MSERNDTEDKSKMTPNVSHSELRQNRALLGKRGRVLLELWQMYPCACLCGLYAHMLAW